ncbi:dynein light chain roadblock-type 1 isoform X1 [Drosophila willistoni]|uniref:dynein light chain roadblock-type 1 isoform X1 n=1 Tax=Drosophila willistoni TaxID=7260 RepID=UPI000C26CDD1|nr:dynein light chain roadblock-type 1 isoform X1 [Drosophila willistoni]
MSSDIEDMFERLLKLPGAEGAILVNGEGIPIRTSMDVMSSQKYAGKMTPLIKMARSMIRDVEPGDDLSYLRLRTRRNELMVAAENDHMVILIQNNALLDQARRTSAQSNRFVSKGNAFLGVAKGVRRPRNS